MTLFLTFLAFLRCFTLIYFLTTLQKAKKNKFLKFFTTYFLYNASFYGILFTLNTSPRLVTFITVYCILINSFSSVIFSSFSCFLIPQEATKKDPLTNILLIGITLSLSEVTLSLFFSAYSPQFFGLFFIQFPFTYSFVYLLTPFILPFIATITCSLFLHPQDKSVFKITLLIILTGWTLNFITKSHSPTPPPFNCSTFNTNISNDTPKGDILSQYKSFNKQIKKNTSQFLLLPESYLSSSSQAYFRTLNINKNTYLVRNHKLNSDNKLFNALLVLNKESEVVFTYKKQLLVPFFEDGLAQKVNRLFSVSKTTKDSQKFYHTSTTESFWIFKNTEIIFLVCSDIFNIIKKQTKLAKTLILCSSNHGTVASLEGKLIARLFLEVQKIVTKSQLCHATNLGYPEKLLYE